MVKPTISVQNPSKFLPSSLQLLHPNLIRKDFLEQLSLLGKAKAFSSGFIERTTLFCPIILFTYDDLLKYLNSITDATGVSRLGTDTLILGQSAPPPAGADVAGAAEGLTQPSVIVCRGNRKSTWGAYCVDVNQGTFFQSRGVDTAGSWHTLISLLNSDIYTQQQGEGRGRERESYGNRWGHSRQGVHTPNAEESGHGHLLSPHLSPGGEYLIILT